MRLRTHRVSTAIWTRRRLPAALALLAALGVAAPAAAAREERASGPTPPRLSFLDGEVSFWRPGAEDWAPAKVNTPLAAGDALYTGDGANLELQIAPRAFVRAGADTELGIDSLESGFLQLKVTGGHAALDVRRLPQEQRIEVDTPNGAFTIDRDGYYRIDVDEQKTTFLTRRGGEASVIPSGGEATDIGPDRQVVLAGGETPHPSIEPAPDADEWDRWNFARTDRLGEPESAQHLPPEVAGADDLEGHGRWRDAPRYGSVWMPNDVPEGWAPYSTGRWIWDPYYGWTWVDDAPWGWAPYHYGRWVFVDGYWGWAPGPVVVAPVYAPALVAFFGPVPGVSVSVNIGFPFVSWVALGFGEPLIPWWGPPGFVGTVWWGGWGGPHIVNNVIVNRTTIVNVNNVNVFRNVNVHNAVVASRQDRFGHGRAEHVRLAAADVQRLRPVRGSLPIKPTAASLAPSEGHARRPPEALATRRVTATRAPRDPATRLRAAGLAPERTAAPAPRLVAPHAPGRAATRQAPPPPPRHARERGLTPPPPRAERRAPTSPERGASRTAPPPREQGASRTAPPPHERGASRSAPTPPRERGASRAAPPPHERSSGRRPPTDLPPSARRPTPAPPSARPSPESGQHVPHDQHRARPPRHEAPPGPTSFGPRPPAARRPGRRPGRAVPA